MTSYKKTNIASGKIVNCRVTSPSNHCCQFSFIVGDRHFFLLLRRRSNIFKLLKLVYSYACMLTSLYQFDNKAFSTQHFLFKVRIAILRWGVKVQFQGEWHSGIAPYTRNWKVSGTNPTDTLGQALGFSPITWLPVTFRLYLK